MKNDFIYIRQLFLRMGILFLAYTLLRIIFFIFNRGLYAEAGGIDLLTTFIYGWRYDLSAMVLSNSLFILLLIIPHPFRSRNFYQKILSGLFLVINGLALAIAVADLVYFQFNKKRISVDLFSMMESLGSQSWQFLQHYWYLFLLFGILFWGMLWLFRRSRLPVVNYIRPRFLPEIIFFLLLSGLSLIAVRGGLQNRPLTPAQAAKDVSPQLASLVTNSPYTFLYSLQKRRLRAADYMSREEASQFFQLERMFNHPDSLSRKNVVVLILESVSREYVGSLNPYPGYTPFLDSLSQHCLVFTNAFASAERSNKALPAILAGIPSLMDDPFMYSAYQDNCMQGLGTYLGSNGYHTSFFHGGLNGEFNMDALAPAAGFSLYFGKNEFNDDTYFDGHWGIYDEEFMQFFEKKLEEFPQPFCTALFTVSSHDPFPIPAKYKDKFPHGESEIQESIGYTDFSLRKFFEKAAQAKWYKNTLFVITADHTFQYGKRLAPRYENRAGYFSVPLYFFTPDQSLSGHNDKLVQHTDIIPSVLDYLHYNGTVRSFGTSVFQDTLNRTAVQYLDNIFQIEDNQYCLLYDGHKAIGLYLYLEDFHFENNLLGTEKDVAENLTKKLEAVLQTYTHALVENKLCLSSSFNN